MNKLKLIKTALKFKYRHSKKAAFWLKNENVVPMAQSAVSVIDKINGSALLYDVEIIKHGSKRLLFRVNSSSSLKKSFIVKVYLLRHLKYKLKYHRIKYDRFSFSEATNLIAAGKRGLDVPKVYGYGHIYGCFWLIKMSIVIMEDLANYTSVRELLKLNKGDEKKCAQILSRTIPIFVSLYKTKCNHVDMNPGSIMLSNENSKQDVLLLDFESAKFNDKLSHKLLLFEAAYFANYCGAWVTERTHNEWRDKLLDAIEIRDNISRRELIERFNYYYYGERLHRKERRKIYM